jgi:hypothetical protein
MNQSEIKRRLIRESSLPLFCRIASQYKWLMQPHLLMICQAIYELLNSDKEILIVNMPPRHGKSELISKFLPAWYLLNNPMNRVILTTYSDTFAEYFGRYCLDLYIMMMKYYGIGLYKRRQASSEWMTSELGGMVSVGAGGSMTGRGADLMLIDDPIKNYADALSATNKENLRDWYQSTATSRLEPGGKVIIIMTRWQPDDLTGQIIETMVA